MFTLTSRLKRYFPKFYLKEKPKIRLTTGIILLSIISRISMNVFLYLFQASIDESYSIGSWLYPGYQLLSSFMSSLFPIAAIIGSLLYAITHKKRMVSVAERTTQVKRKGARDSMQSLLEHEEGSGEFEDDSSSNLGDVALLNNADLTDDSKAIFLKPKRGPRSSELTPKQQSFSYKVQGGVRVSNRVSHSSINSGSRMGSFASNN